MCDGRGGKGRWIDSKDILEVALIRIGDKLNVNGKDGQ